MLNYSINVLICFKLENSPKDENQNNSSESSNNSDYDSDSGESDYYSDEDEWSKLIDKKFSLQFKNLYL